MDNTLKYIMLGEVFIAMWSHSDILKLIGSFVIGFLVINTFFDEGY